MKKFFLYIFIYKTSLFLFFISNAGLSAEPEIIQSLTRQKIQYQELAEISKNYDVVLLGEEHDDTSGHDEKLKLIHYLVKNSSRDTILGLEMLEKDRQQTLNEFLSDIISLSSFFQSIQPNNVKPYFAILSYAKEMKIPVIATNAPRKYVNIVSRKGLEGLGNLTASVKKYLPPLYLVNFFQQREYEVKVNQAFSFHSPGHTNNKMMQAMYLWDTAMADSIASSIPFRNKLFIHINGRYHSDEGFGITYRLRQLGFKVLTVSMIPSSNRTDADEKYGDIIYYTGN